MLQLGVYFHGSSQPSCFPNLPNFCQWPKVYWGIQFWGEKRGYRERLLLMSQAWVDNDKCTSPCLQWVAEECLPCVDGPSSDLVAPSVLTEWQLLSLPPFGTAPEIRHCPWLLMSVTRNLPTSPKEGIRH